MSYSGYPGYADATGYPPYGTGYTTPKTTTGDSKYTGQAGPTGYTSYGTGYTTQETTLGETTSGFRRNQTIISCCLITTSLCLVIACVIALLYSGAIAEDLHLNKEDTPTNYDTLGEMSKERSIKSTRALIGSSIPGHLVATNGMPGGLTTTREIAETTSSTLPTSTTTSTTTTTTTKATTTTTATSTEKLSTADPPPLLCSVGFPALLAPVFPPDSVCDIVVYTHVRVVDKKLAAVLTDRPFEMFRNSCRLYSLTACGLSFHVEHLYKGMFNNMEIREELETAKSTERIHHYGVIILGEKHDVEQYALTAIPFVKEFRSLLGEDRKTYKTILGFGFYNYPGGADSIAYLAGNTATPHLDIMVIITALLVIPEQWKCTTLPVSAWITPSTQLLSMESALPMAMRGFLPEELTIAFSFQMGVVLYKADGQPKTAREGLYKRCKAGTFTDYTQGCNEIEEILETEKVAISLNFEWEHLRTRNPFIASYEKINTMKEKAQLVMQSPGIRANFTWFLFNVHLTDIARRCSLGGPFKRVKAFKSFFQMEWRRRNP